MRLARPLFALMFVTSFAAFATAQTAPPADTEALKTLKHDIVSAYRSMRPCLPIYEGHRGSSENAVHQAEAIVNAAIAAITPPAPPKEAVKEPEKPKTKEGAQKKVEPKPPVKAPVSAEKPQETEAEKIAKSQAGMRKALEAIQKALKDVKAVSGTMPDDKAAQVEKLLQTAEAEATKSIALHASEG